MPKKFKGQNSKAAEAKEAKEAARNAAEREKRRKQEDEYWRDDEDKHAQKKQERKAEKERKRIEQLDRKHQAKVLLEEEDSQLKGKGSGGVPRPTRAQIAEAEEQKRKQRQSEAETALPQGVVEAPVLEKNPNRFLQAQREKGDLDARTVDEAIDILGGPCSATPDKNAKALYAAFEERELPQLRVDNPNMRLSQLKQLLSKKWMRSPENPFNH